MPKPDKKATLAAQLIEWIEANLTYPRGPKMGESVRLLGWEKRAIRGLFKRNVETAAVSMARGNSKTTWCSYLGAAAVEPSSPLTSDGYEALAVASSFQQIKKTLFKRVVYHLQHLGHDLDNRKVWRKLDSPQNAEIEYKKTGATLFCIGSDVSRSLGFHPSLIIADEGAEWPTNQADKMYGSLETSLGKAEGAKLLAVGTRPSDEMHFFSKLLDGQADFILQYRADPDLDPFDKETIRQSNPSLSALPGLRRTIQKAAEKAKRDPAQLARFRHWRLNQGGSPVERSQLLEAGEWERIEALPSADRIGQMILGVDLGENQAFTAATGYWPESGLVDCFAAVPGIPGLEERERRDGAVGAYSSMAKRGELVLLGQRTVPLDEFLHLVLGRFGQRPAVLVCDTWKKDRLLDAMEKVGLQCPVKTRRMGFGDLGSDTDQFVRGCLDDKVRPEVSLLMRSAIGECVVETDSAGNSRPTKSTTKGKRRRGRDDAAISTIFAVGEGLRSKGEGGPRYEFHRV